MVHLQLATPSLSAALGLADLAPDVPASTARCALIGPPLPPAVRRTELQLLGERQETALRAGLFQGLHE